MANKQKILTSAQKFIQKGNYAKAIREYERAVEMDPNDLRVLLKLGEAYQKDGDVEGAIETYNRVARRHATTGFLLKAAAVYKRILSLQPTNVEVHVRLAEVYHQLGLLSDAMSFYYAVANILHESGDQIGYQDVLGRMAIIEPDNVGIRIKLAEHYSRMGELEAAVEEFGLAADLLRKTGRLDDYVKVAERLIYHKPNALWRIKDLVRVYLQQGDTRRALAKIQMCTKASPQDTETLDLLIETFEALGQPEKAFQVIREKARIHDSRQELQKAQECWRRLLEFNPLDQEVRERLGLADPAQGQSEPTSGHAPLPSSTPNIQAQIPTAPARIGHVQPALKTAVPTAPAHAISAPPHEALAQEDPSFDTQQVEIQRLLTETDVYIKYGLVDRAFEHLRKVFLMDPNNLDAMERIKEMHFQAGYYPQAVDELLRMTKLAYHRDTDRALGYLREAIQLMPGNEEALQLAASYGLTRDDLFPAIPNANHTQDLPGADSVDTMLAQLTAEVLDDDDLADSAAQGEIEIEIEIDLDGDDVELIQEDFASIDDDLGEVMVLSQMDDLAEDLISVDDPSQVLVIEDMSFDPPPIQGEDTVNIVDPLLDEDLKDIQEGFGLSNHEIAQLSRSLSMADDEDSRSSDLVDEEAQPLMEELFLNHQEGDTDESYVPPEDGDDAIPAFLEDTAEWREDQPGPVDRPSGAFIDTGDEEDLDDLILIDDDDDDEDDEDTEIAVEALAPTYATVEEDPISPEILNEPPPARPALVTPPPPARQNRPGPLITPPNGDRNKPLSPYAKHFQNEVATTAYAPFSDRGTVTEADLDKGKAPNEAATSMIDIHEMRRRMLEDMRRSSLDSQDPSSAVSIVADDGDTMDLPEDLRLDIEESDFYIQQGLVEEAKATLTELLDEHPGTGPILRRLRTLGSNNLEASGSTRAMERPPSDPSMPALVSLPMPPLQDKPALESAGSDDLSSHFELGLAYREMGLHQDSISEFQRAIDEGHQISESHFLMGQSYVDLGDLKESIAQFKQALETAPASDALQPHILYRLGLVHEAIGDGTEAAGFFRKIATRSDLFPDVGQRLNSLTT